MMKGVIVSILMLLSTCTIDSQPINDECINATIIPSNVVLPYRDTVSDIANATRNENDDTLASCFDDINAGSIWYYWEPTATVDGDFNVRGVNASAFDIFPFIAIFTGNNCGTMQEVACDLFTISSLSVTVGQTYFVGISTSTRTFDGRVTFEVTENIAPPNDECVDAINIPSNVGRLPYSTPPVNYAEATSNPIDPVSSCSIRSSFPTSAPIDLPSIVPTSAPFGFAGTVWYNWTPSIGGRYTFSVKDSTTVFGIELPADIEIYQGEYCDAVVEIACSASISVLLGVELNAGTTYFIKVAVELGSFIDALILEVTQTPPPLPNDECRNAINVDPLDGNIVIGNTRDAFVDDMTDPFCGVQITAPGIWYKTSNNFSSPMAIVAATCNSETTFDTQISIFAGTCDNLKCVGGNDDRCGSSSSFTFVASPRTTYYILVHGFGSLSGEFALTVDGSLNFFSLIDATTNKVIQIIAEGDTFVSYNSFPSAALNIQASFEKAESVRVTFDNPRRFFCEEDAPYAVFRDNKGDFFNATIPIGIHTVTATSYASTGCKRPAGTSLSRTFEVTGCDVVFFVHSSSPIPNVLTSGGTIKACNINIQAVPNCGFDVGFVTMQLRNTDTDTLVFSKRERFDPFFLFGNVDDVANRSSIEPGNYTIEVIIDKILHPAVSFSAVVDERCN